MKNKSNVISSLVLKKLVFEKINFLRKGFKNDTPPKLTLETSYAKSADGEELFRVMLSVHCNKEEEYEIDISLLGFFTFSTEHDLSDEDKDILISKNSVAIMMPYLRSEISLLTAQPETDCLVLPPFNINEMLDEANEMH